MAVYRMSGTTNADPYQWSASLFAEIGVSEPFVWQLTQEMMELVDAGKIVEPARTKVKEAILLISLEGLMPAFENLKAIRASVTKPLPILNTNQLYEKFCDNLWVAYKEFMQKAAQLMGYDIGFLFKQEVSFEECGAEFSVAHSAPTWFVPYLRDQRTKWHNRLREFRNTFIEHKNVPREVYDDYYRPGSAEALFEAVWQAIANILAVLLGMQLYAALIEIPKNERSVVNPRRFRFAVEGLSAPEEFDRLFIKLGPEET